MFDNCDKILAGPLAPVFVWVGGFLFNLALAYGAYWVASQFAKPGKNKMPTISTYPLQQSMKATPIQKVLGSDRVAGNIIWLGDLHPYTVEHDSGGKGGGGGEKVEETRYRRSFLINVAEGIAEVSRCWKGKKEISTSKFTWFNGDNNVGVKALTGELYGDYKNNAMAFFDEYDLGNMEMIPNFVFELCTKIDNGQYPTLQALTAAEIPTTPSAPSMTTGVTAVSTAAQLEAMSGSGSYYLANDIDLNAYSWTPITGFTGVLDGRGKTISNLTLNNPTLDDQGLFGDCGNGVEIHDVTIKDFDITGRDNVGALIGQHTAGILKLKDVTIENPTLDGDYYIGGLVGYIAGVTEGIVYNCDVTTPSITCVGWSGGAFGDLEGASVMTDDLQIVDCNSTGGTITATLDESLGGLVGYSEGDGSATYDIEYYDCSATTGITCNPTSSGVGGIGGFCGRSVIGNRFITCTASGTIAVTATGSDYLQGCAGFVGFEDSSSLAAARHINCSTSSDINIDANTAMDVVLTGGYIGKYDSTAHSSMLRCYATGDISIIGLDDLSTTLGAIGGFVGGLLIGTGGGCEVKRCWATGDITVNSADLGDTNWRGGLGGFAGIIYAGATPSGDTCDIFNCYAWGSITITNPTDASSNDLRVAGFAGSVNAATDKSATINITNCYAPQTDIVTGSGFTDQLPDGVTGAGATYSEGFIGWVERGSVGNMYINETAIFWDVQTSGIDTDNYASGQSTAWLMTKQNFVNQGWDFTSIWYMPDPVIVCNDMNPADIIEEIATHNRWGARIDGGSWIHSASFLSCWNYWDSENMLLSIVLDDSMPWLDWVDYVLSHCDGFRFKKGGKLALGVLRDESAVVNLTDDDLVQPNPESKELPPKVNVTKRPYSDTHNRIEVVWSDRANNYDASIAVAYDPVDIARSGKLRQKQVKLFGIKSQAYAQRMAYRFLIDALYRFSIYKFIVSYKHMRLETGDVVTITDNHLLSNEKVRIMHVQEDEHGRGLAVTAIEDYAEHYPSIGFASQGNLFTWPASTTLADGTLAFRADPDQSKLYLAITPGNAQVNGFYVYRSYDDASYSLVGRAGISGVTGGAANSRGTILGSLPAHEVHEWAPTEWFDVDIGTLTDLASASSEGEFWGDRKLAKIGSEVIAYKTVREIAAGIWRVSDLRRGLFGTTAAAHVASETFETLDTNFTYAIQPADVNQTIYFKVLAYYASDIQQLADVTGQAVTIDGDFDRPAAACLLRLTSDENSGGSGNYSGSSFTLYWNLAAKDSGHNWNGYDVSGGGGPYNHYLQDPALQAIILKFEETDGTPIGEREITVKESETITLATDLGGHSPAVVKVVPRRALAALKEAALTVTQV
jgi:hypothetical protein